MEMGFAMSKGLEPLLFGKTERGHKKRVEYKYPTLHLPMKNMPFERALQI